MLMSFGLMALVGCKEQKHVESNIITIDYEAPQPTSPISMSRLSDVQEVEWMDGHRYTLRIVRQPADSLQMVVNSEGQKYIDNVIRLEVARADSSLFYSHTYSKASFTDWLTDDYCEKAILQGIRFLEVDGSALSFIVWLNYPDAADDEAVELNLTINAQRNVGIQRFTYNDRDDKVTEEEKKGGE